MAIKIEENISLANLSTLKVGGTARFFISIKKREDIFEVFHFIKENKLRFIVLGGGSNILFSDNVFDKVVLKMETKGIHFLEIDNNVFVEVEAGESWDYLVAKVCKENLWGIENLSGIPGTVGASVVQNIGAYGIEVKEAVEKVEVFDTDSLSFKFLAADECGFGYRNSIFKYNTGKNLVVTKVYFRLSTSPKPNLLYKDLAQYFIEGTTDIKQVRNAVLDIRKKKFPDLALYGTAGSFFKNIVVSKERFKDVRDKFPDMVFYETPSGEVKLSSAWILDKLCGLKGHREGEVGLYENQPLVLVNFGTTHAKDIKAFAEKIKQQVKEKTGLVLEEEVVIL